MNEPSLAAAPLAWREALLAEQEALHGPFDPATRARVLADDSGNLDIDAGRLAVLHQAIHERGATALCLSGGGIRSASFAIGVLQALARLGLVTQFDYLSTVSGGGFAGSWLTAWMRRAQDDTDARLAFEEFVNGMRGTGRVEPAPLMRLRGYTRYLTPRAGAFSADAWTLGTTMLRNLLLNWLVIVPVLACALLVPRIHYSLVYLSDRATGPGPSSSLSAPAWWCLAVALVALAASVLFVIRDLPGFGNARQSEGRFLLWCLAPLGLGAHALTYVWALDQIALPLSWMAGGFAVGHAALWVGAEMFTARRWRPRTWLAALMAGAVAGGGLTWLAERVFANGAPLHQVYVSFAFPLVLIVVLAAGLVFVGVASEEMHAGDLEWWSRAAAWLLIVVAAWLAVSGIVFGGPMLFEFIKRAVLREWLQLEDASASLVLGGLTSLVGALGAWLARSSNQAAASSPKRLALLLAGPLVFLLLLAGIAWATELAVSAMSGAEIIEQAERGTVLCGVVPDPRFAGRCHPPGAGLAETLVLGAALLAFGLVMSRLVPVNRFSLNGMYRWRLTRAFLGASRRVRRPNAFTGFDPDDDLAMSDLALVRPLHVVNTTLNCEQGTPLAQQDRNSYAFTISPLHAGSPAVGYRPSSAFAASPETGRGVSLGTAMTISGAAASPMIGRQANPVFTFLMTIFNARLGAWMGNPGGVSDPAWRCDEPSAGALLVFHELLGLTSLGSRYLYLSDGGHYDNLGLIEMVRRRANLIVVSDAGADPGYVFDDLATAVRQVRMDLGIRVELGSIDIELARQGNDNPHCLVGTIHYEDVDPGCEPGTLVYLKPALSGDEPADIRNYAATHAAFPNEPTTNQWFSEAQFESYRMLGIHTVESVSGGLPDHGPGLSDLLTFCHAARRYCESNASWAVPPAAG